MDAFLSLFLYTSIYSFSINFFVISPTLCLTQNAFNPTSSFNLFYFLIFVQFSYLYFSPFSHCLKPSHPLHSNRLYRRISATLCFILNLSPCTYFNCLRITFACTKKNIAQQNHQLDTRELKFTIVLIVARTHPRISDRKFYFFRLHSIAQYFSSCLVAEISILGLTIYYLH